MKGEPMKKLTKDQKRDIRAIAAKRDEDIDFSDAPAVVDWSGAEIGKFYRPTKKSVTMRPASSHGSKPMVAVTRPKQIGFYGTPCFTPRER